MSNHKEQILEELEKQLYKLALLFRSADEKDLKPVVKGAVLDVFNLFSKTQQATIGEVEKAFEEYKKWLAEQHKIELGAGDAVDVTANAMRMAQIERGANNVRDFILDKLKKEGG